METENKQTGKRAKGISPELFCDKVEDEFYCTHCNFVLWMAMQASCGCRFCLSCIQSENAECASCKVQINKEEITDDFYVRRRLRKKQLFCLNKPHGCDVILEFKDLDEHLKQCKYIKVNCIHFKSGCQTRLFRTDLKRHLEKECEYRLVRCDYCDDQISFNKIKNHDCVNKPIVCPNQCGPDTMRPEQLNEHLKNTCPLVMVSCQFVKMGCNTKFLRKDVEVHEEQNASKHLLMVSKKSEEQNLINVKLGRENADLESKCELLTNKFEAMSANYVDTRNKLQNMESEFQKFRDMARDMFKQIQKNVQKSSQEFKEQVALLHEEQKEQSQCLQELQTKTTNRRDQANILPPARLDGTLETHLTLMKVDISELKLKVSCLEETSYDGTLLWRIPDIDKSTREAINGKTTSLYSQPFYSSRYGYKMCLRLYLNGDGMGRNTHMSLFFVIMRGMYDALLPWPFNQNVTLILLDQKTGQRSMSDSFQPDRNSSSFQMPKRNRDMNVASGCPLFVSKGVLRDQTYVKDDTMYIKAIVEQMPVGW